MLISGEMSRITVKNGAKSSLEIIGISVVIVIDSQKLRVILTFSPDPSQGKDGLANSRGVDWMVLRLAASERFFGRMV